MWPVSFVAVDEPTYRRWVFPSPFPSLWRTGTYMSMNWMLFMGLLEYGYHEPARRIAHGSVLLVERGGFREFYDSRSGRGYGGKNYGMSTLAVDIRERLNGAGRGS